MTWRAYRRTGTISMRPFELVDMGDGRLLISASDRQHILVCADLGVHPGGYVARDPARPDDCWYVNQAYADQHYVEAD